jgi:hypothetical protein
LLFCNISVLSHAGLKAKNLEEAQTFFTDSCEFRRSRDELTAIKNTPHGRRTQPLRNPHNQAIRQDIHLIFVQKKLIVEAKKNLSPVKRRGRLLE